MGLRRGLVAILAVALPVFFYMQHRPAWALGLLVGESLGAVHYLWVSRTVRRGLNPAGNIHWAWFLSNSVARLGMAGLVFFAVLKWPAVTIGSVLAGFSLVLLSASILRLDRAAETKEKI